MSMIKCDYCPEYIDSDETPWAYDETYDRWLCDICIQRYREEKEWLEEHL